MNPFQRNKVDISKLNPQEQQLFAKYGKLPTHKNILTKMQKDRKYFDSGDYALSKAGKAPQSTVGTAIPNPENIPHASTPTNGHPNNGHPISLSPTNSISKESGLATDQNTTPPAEEATGESASAEPAKKEEAELVDTEMTEVVVETAAATVAPTDAEPLVPATSSAIAEDVVAPK